MFTFYPESEAISRRSAFECRLEAIRSQKWWHDVAQNVNLHLFVTLMLLPDERRLKHVQIIHLELARDVQRLSRVQDEHLTLSQHRHKRRCKKRPLHVVMKLNFPHLFSSSFLCRDGK